MPLYPDLLNEDCSDISDWTSGDSSTAVSEVDPAGQFRFDTNGSVGADATRYIVGASIPIQFTLEIKTYFDVLGTRSNVDVARLTYDSSDFRFGVWFASDGLYKMVGGGATYEFGTNLVKSNATAAWQVWRFQVDRSAGPDSVVVEVFLDDIPQGSYVSNYTFSGTEGKLEYSQLSFHTANMVSHIDYIKVGTGLDKFYGSTTSDFLKLL